MEGCNHYPVTYEGHGFLVVMYDDDVTLLAFRRCAVASGSRVVEVRKHFSF